MTTDSIALLASIRAREGNIRLLANMREKLRRRAIRWQRLLILSLALAAVLAISVGLEHMRKAEGLTYLDKVQLNRLIDKID